MPDFGNVILRDLSFLQGVTILGHFAASSENFYILVMIFRRMYTFRRLSRFAMPVHFVALRKMPYFDDRKYWPYNGPAFSGSRKGLHLSGINARAAQVCYIRPLCKQL